MPTMMNQAEFYQRLLTTINILEGVFLWVRRVSLVVEAVSMRT